MQPLLLLPPAAAVAAAKLAAGCSCCPTCLPSRAAAEDGVNLQSWLLCVEMLPAAIFMLFAFPWCVARFGWFWLDFWFCVEWPFCLHVLRLRFDWFCVEGPFCLCVLGCRL